MVAYKQCKFDVDLSVSKGILLGKESSQRFGIISASLRAVFMKRHASHSPQYAIHAASLVLIGH